VIRGSTTEFVLGAAAIIALSFFGCAADSSAQLTTATAKESGPPLAVQDCVLIGTGSPSTYQCGDKTYTSYDLTKMQRDFEAQQHAAH
jgi:hypothetical protein